MRLRRWVICLLVCTAGAFSILPAWAQSETYQYIDIRNPFLRKVPLAVPLFKNQAGGPREDENSRKAVDLMAGSLDFTGYFKILDRGAFLFDPQKSGVAAADINFQNWTVVGAELLITGTFEQTGDNVTMELRLFDTIRSRQVLGKRYSGNAAETRKMILRFCAEVIYYLTGNKGIFNSKIAFVSTGSGKKEIYTCDFDGYNPTRLTYNDSISLFPSWSSDGQYLAYTSYKGGKPDIYIRNLADKRESVIAQEGLNITPAWAPDRLELAATMSFSGDQEIYLLTGTGKMIKRADQQSRQRCFADLVAGRKKNGLCFQPDGRSPDLRAGPGQRQRAAAHVRGEVQHAAQLVSAGETRSPTAVRWEVFTRFS